MYTRQLITCLLLLFLSSSMRAQQTTSFEEADAKSYALYNKAAWQELLDYGNSYIQEGGADFIYLRLRLGYAAFMLGNYSTALTHYDAALKKDSYQETAHYYSRLCRIYLNQPEQAEWHSKYLSAETKSKEKIKNAGFTKLGVEVSYKTTNYNNRGNGLYVRADVQTQLHRNVFMQHSAAIYNQTIAEASLIAVQNNNQIQINQNEYYNKTIINAGKHIQVLLAYHYLKTPFNNFAYNNHTALAGVRYNGSQIAVQGDVNLGTLSDTSVIQANLHLQTHPFGNMNFYSISTGSFRSREGTQAFNFKQVVGGKVFSKLWLEGNITLGNFSNYFENDLLYVYNAIDLNKIKGGLTAYVTLTPKITLQAGYTYESRQFYKSTRTFSQHSITGGLSCKL